MTAEAEADAPVLLRTRGRAAHLTLDRPRALNSLTLPMIRRIAEALDAWEHDPSVGTVVLTGAGERGLCAGADIRLFHDDARSGDGSRSEAFWRAEYRLDARIAHYPKPYVAVMDGIVMGGGVGLSAHGSVRIVTERSRVAMPEVGIGFVPDVGGTYLLSRAPGELGTHLALTGGAIGAADAVLCGLADHHVPSAALPALLDDLATSPADEAVARHARPAPDGELAGQRTWIDACYAADTVEEIVDRLHAYGDPAPKDAAETLLAQSPTALKVTLAALRRARAFTTLEQALDQEFRVACAALATPDLPEGVRARIIDKDRTPHWSPATLAEVTPAEVDRHFAPLGARELGLA
ncbi:enoyl-CoA hydratase/isomerase family protein [Streptomyces sp. SID5785]|uniref:enoyl-CoA hydratase/isomerase family protein n=1 Tax=Streptomyces sp. SID5785 TaxID=2690309 RepID=UPI001361C675|nr:enoyl-CoA hydratase/isomerase family protein [Streptomyces sp. SID5785]MZD09582.1 enoyl-CoA hydratase/isomerase family protein [Streptomyces sp. SID5785]